MATLPPESPGGGSPPREYLRGGVVITSLAARSQEGRFRAEDERGEVAWLAAGTPFDALHLAEFRAAGARRGFHRHRQHDEHFYLFRGRVRLYAGRPGEPEHAEAELGPGDLARIAPGVAHGFIALEPALAVVYGTGSHPIDDCLPAPELSARVPSGS